MNYFAVHLKLTQHCKLTIPQLKKKNTQNLTPNFHLPSYHSTLQSPSLCNALGCCSSPMTALSIPPLPSYNLFSI